ncbi:gamma-glutamyltranspeptidase/glutathione hydrolase [Natronospira proteinivora]|uniref:Glutathione hydrolase proenzyme n=1 Tax=Natronospira proteinivora TaxID=1807133 RepID=A0ABT1GB74_9GAMM|nr:gamma-glutamyltransferase [Natronospira proteinivora]MCP1728536.1 gamma-glutamyltranspeptidase/glutathione hydrolase [Natronospira proteinivora]
MSGRYPRESWATRSEIFSSHGMAATSQPLATQAALRVLRSGGSAVDAAIAANAVLCVVEPTGAGLGGDLFAMLWDPNEKAITGLNASGGAPTAGTRSWFEGKGHERIPDQGPLSISVPGAVGGWFALHEKHGRLPMSEVLATAVSLAEEGFPVSEVIAEEWAREGERLAEQPGFAATFLPSGRAPRKGERFRNPALARLLGQIGENGEQVFYQGPVARSMAETVQQAGGLLAEQDLAGYKAQWVEPVSVDFQGKTVWQLPPNGQGLVAAQMLKLLEPWDLKSAGFGSPDHVHLLVEAKKLAFADRARFYADPDFERVPVQGLLDEAYLNERRTLIDPTKAARSVSAGEPRLDAGDTVYLTVADESGMMVSLIQSNYMGMGSGVVPVGLGFSLQNRGALFSLQPGHPNVIAPGKRPFHTIMPGFVTRDGEPWLSFGVMGGAMQPQGQVQILLNLLVFGMNLQAAGDAPRIRHDGSAGPTGKTAPEDGGVVNLEPGFPEGTAEALSDRGHQVRVGQGHFGGYQAIAYNPVDRLWRGASEYRKDGQASGY